MASVNIYNTTIDPVLNMLRALSGVLKKAEAYADEKSIPHAEFTEARLAPDMLPLTFQIQTASDSARNIAFRVGGIEKLSIEDNEKTFAELQARIAKTIEYLSRTKKEDFEGKEGIEVTFLHFKFTGLSYITTFAMPNFYFHVTTAYDILRMKGVPLGKRDFLGGS